MRTLSFCTLVTTLGLTLVPACAQVSCGDCDENGAVADILDALEAAQVSAGLSSPSLTQVCACDIDNNAAVTILDALVMAQNGVGLPVVLTCPAPVCGCTLVTCGTTTPGTVGAPTCTGDFDMADSTAYLIDASSRGAGESVLVRLLNQSDDVDLYVPVAMPGCGDPAAVSWTCATGGCLMGGVDETHFFDDATVTAFGEMIPIWVRHPCGAAATAATYDLEVSCVAYVPGMMVFSYTGMMETFIPPAGVATVHIVARGAEGAGGAGGAIGGLGGEAEGDLAVTGGSTVLNIFVGGTGQTFNGGSAGGAAGGGTGGGASDVRVGGTATANRVITAGGGGGGGGRGCLSLHLGGDGGAGGGGTGTKGADSPNGGGGFGGAPGVGGAAGIGCGGFLGSPGQATGQGGNGQTCCCFSGNFNPGGGGGGGGFLDGGGGGGGSAGTTGCSGNDKGGGGGGGGGDSDTSGVTGGITQMGVRAGDGEVIISW